MYDIREITYGTEDYAQMVDLRDRLLRRPLGLYFTPGQLAEEAHDVLIGGFATQLPDTPLIGCGILTPAGARIQLRQMAVAEDYQRTGLGSALVGFAETLAADRGFQVLFLHARLGAVPFYEKLGYRRQGAIFTEVTLPHYCMDKVLGR
jgi:GNAT superfamily N-acetyltransferase